MFAPAPGWQTGELEEEWVESSPPAASLKGTLPRLGGASGALQERDAASMGQGGVMGRTQESIRAKRGSLRALGRPRVPLQAVSGQEGDRQAKGKFVGGDGEGKQVPRSHSIGSGGLISPPTSRSSSGQSHQHAPGPASTSTLPRTQNQAGATLGHGTVGTVARGTFIVKEGVEDDRGAALAARGRGGAGGGKGAGGLGGGLFGPSKLERMFEPPSPPSVVPAVTVGATTVVSQRTTSISANPSVAPAPAHSELEAKENTHSPPTDLHPVHQAQRSNPTRRLSHQHVPPIPSRLSKSITPSLPSSSLSGRSTSSLSDRSDLNETPGPAVGAGARAKRYAPDQPLLPAEGEEEDREEEDEVELGLPSLPGIEPEEGTRTYAYSQVSRESESEELADDDEHGYGNGETPRPPTAITARLNDDHAIDEDTFEAEAEELEEAGDDAEPQQDEEPAELSFSPSLGPTESGDPSHSTLPRHAHPPQASLAGASRAPNSSRPKQHVAQSPRRKAALAASHTVQAAGVRARLTSSNLRLSQSSFSGPPRRTAVSPQRGGGLARNKAYAPRFKSPSQGDQSRPAHYPRFKSPSRGDQSRLRLFRSTYDTYTREHLSALVDSFALDGAGFRSPIGSGSPITTDTPALGRRPGPEGESGEADESDFLSWFQSQRDEATSEIYAQRAGGAAGANHEGEDEEGRSEDDSVQDEGEQDDTRSSKRMRMSPRSPTEVRFPAPATAYGEARLPAPVHASSVVVKGSGESGRTGRMDWGGRAREMMARIKDRGLDHHVGGDSTTTAEGEVEHSGSGRQGRGGVDEADEWAEVEYAAQDQAVRRGGGGAGLGDILGQAIAENLVHGDISYFSPVSSPEKRTSASISDSQSPASYNHPAAAAQPFARPMPQTSGPAPTHAAQAEAGAGGTHRSKTSTTSSTYLREAQDLMSRIKARVVSVSNESEGAGSSVPSQMDSISRHAIGEVGVGSVRAGPGRARISPRRMLRRLSASEEVRRAAEAEGEEDEEEAFGAAEHHDDEGAGQQHRSHQLDVSDSRREDLHRFLSSTTHRTMTATATATFPSTITGTGMYIKHPGPASTPAPALPKSSDPNGRAEGADHNRAGALGQRAGMRTLGPEEVRGLLGSSGGESGKGATVGGMRYDPVGMRWVRDDQHAGKRDDGGNEAEGIEEEEVDVFAHFSSSDGSTRLASTPAPTALAASSPATHEDPQQGQPEEPLRPTPVHANSAPAVLTPLPPSKTQAAPPRSALRQANTPLRAALEGGKKRAGWHQSVTPLPESAHGPGGETGGASGSGGGRGRSVSFSDGRTPGDESLAGGAAEGAGRTQRLEKELDGLKDLTLSDLTPSKPGKTRQKSNAELEEDVWPIPHDSYSTPNPFHSYAHEPSRNHPSTASRLFGSLPRDETLSGAGDQNQTVQPHAAVPHRPARGGRADRTFGARSTRSVHPEKTFAEDQSFHVADPALVKLVTDVYGSEPYWDELEILDLRGKGVETVRRLEEFCGSGVLSEVYLDNNKLSYLTGIPSSVQVLHVPNNRLTSLSSVGHLAGLRELDLSGNKLDQVTQLACLVNLEILKVDKNKIHSLDGVLEMRKLRELSVSGNKLDRVDLRAARWPELKQLDLSCNKLTTVNGLDRLPKLKELNLDDNQLSIIMPSAPLAALRSLRVSSNALTNLDLALFPGLRTLYADCNELETITSPGSKSRLASLSVRSQRVAGLGFHSSLWNTLERVYISGNSLSTSFWPQRECPALIYLELGACSLRDLPAMKRTFPSLRALNLNFNQLTSLSSLKGLVGLRKLSVVGNQLGDGGLSGLEGLKALEEVDLRMNPLTLPFYLPILSSLPLVPVDSEESEPVHRLNARPLPSVTQATIHPSSLPGASSFALGLPSPPAGQQWATLDLAWRHKLPDDVYARRMIYRALVCRALKGVKRVDGLHVGVAEKRKGESLLLRAARASV